MTVPAAPERDRLLSELPVVVEEEVSDRIASALLFVATVLDRIDPVRRLSDVLPVVALDRSSLGWRTRAEHERSPSSGSMSLGPARLVVTLSPPRRHRAALDRDVGHLSEDLTVLLRRAAKAR